MTISTDTHIALYADDTKIWRSIKNEQDIVQLQRDINILYFWSHNNSEILLTKANQKFGILKRTCHFVTCKNRRIVLYLALVRSQFEHCSPVWRPGSITMMNKFESFQKNASSGFSLRRKNPTLMRFI